MDNRIHFETPENVRIHYEPAGLGTRFLAWFIDQVLLWILTLFTFILTACAGVSFQAVFEAIDPDLFSDEGAAFYFFFGLMLLVWGLGSFLYFGLSELLLRGQTIGKRMTHIRVVKVDGFALDAASVLVRNLFRVADHLPPMWIIPLLSARSQRAGDMVGGTVVVSDDPQTLSEVRVQLSDRKALEAEFRFGPSNLKRLRPGDVQAIERILERWDELPNPEKFRLLDTMVEPLAQRLGVEPPPVSPTDRRVRFLEDLLAAEFRRRHRSLG